MSNIRRRVTMFAEQSEQSFCSAGENGTRQAVKEKEVIGLAQSLPRGLDQRATLLPAPHPMLTDDV
jgi:hypothetical protein